MSDNAYDSEMLRVAARGHRKSSAAAESAGRALGSAQVAAHPFGNVEGAGTYAGSLGKAQEHHLKGARAAAETGNVRSGRADRTADLGDGLVADTTAVAHPDRVRSIADGMS